MWAAWWCSSKPHSSPEFGSTIWLETFCLKCACSGSTGCVLLCRSCCSLRKLSVDICALLVSFLKCNLLLCNCIKKSCSFTLNVFVLALCSIIKVSKLLIHRYGLGVQRFRLDFEFVVNTNKFYKKYMKQNCP